MSCPRYIRHLFVPDLHYPDCNLSLFDTFLSFIPDFKPDVVHILGDWVNFTNISKYLVPSDYHTTLGEEITGARNLLKKLVKACGGAKINYFQGNHEQRLEKFLARNASELADITEDDGESLLTIPHLFHLKSLGINYIKFDRTYLEKKICIEHGDNARCKSGFTGNAMIDKRGRSGVSGHTHRLCLVVRNQGGDVKFWIESGYLGNLKPNPNYVKEPDWVNGFSVMIYDNKEKLMHPQAILIQKGQFFYNGKSYK